MPFGPPDFFLRYMMRYCIGDFDLQLKTKWMPLLDDELMENFRHHGQGESQLSYRVGVLEPGVLSESKILKRTGGYELLETERGLFLLNHWAKCRYAYGFWLSDLREETTIYFHPDMAQQLPLPVSFLLSTAGLHRKLLERDAVVIHASYIEHNGKAILFLGPSGTGKSTQATLWSRYAHGQIVNGDRALLRQTDGIWKAYGYPCCGSSDICLNRTLPVAAIVVLQKSLENKIEELPLSRMLCALVSGTELYPWDEWEVSQAFRLGEKIAAQIPVIRLSCRADEEAVTLLKNYLEGNL